MNPATGAWILDSSGVTPMGLGKKAMRSMREELHGRIFALSPVTIYRYTVLTSIDIHQFVCRITIE